MSETSDFVLRVLDLIARADLHDDLFWRTDGPHAPVTFWVNCSDVFDWGCGDLEPLTEERLPELERALRDVAEACGDELYRPDYGPMLYCARMRAMRPQGAAYPDTVQMWPLLDACGPEREIGPHNPYRPGERTRGRQRAYSAVLAELAREMERQDQLHPSGYPPTRDGVFLGIRTAIHELEGPGEALDAWSEERCKCPTPQCGHATWSKTRAEVLQAAAVCMRTIRSIPAPAVEG